MYIALESLATWCILKFCQFLETTHYMQYAIDSFSSPEVTVCQC